MDFKGIDTKFLYREIAKHNRHKILELSKINFIAILAISLIIFIGDYLLIEEETFFSTLPLVFLAIFNAIALLFFKFYRFAINDEYNKMIQYGLFLYVTLTLFCAAFFILMHQNYLTVAHLYSIIAFSAAAFFVMKLGWFLLPIMSSSMVVIGGLLYKQEPFHVVSTHALFFIGVLVIAGLLSYRTNKFFIRTIKTKAELVNENNYRKHISKQLREANRKLSLQNTLDPLTGLQNRMSLNQQLERLKMFANHNRMIVTAIMIDIDCFKKFNDYYGHSLGDEVIAKVGKVILDVSDQYGIFAARYGGEEFIMLIQSESEIRVKRICEEILAKVVALEIPHKKSDVDSIVTVSIGAKVIKATSPEDIIQAIESADSLLYEVKRTGKNAYLMQIK